MNAEQLKNSILQRAIEGKLVEQREEEGTAAELLREIKAEKARLVKEGKLKKEKPLRSITAEEIPFEIPESWEWTTLSHITSERTLNDGNWILSSDMVDNGEVKLIQLGSIGNCKYINKGFKYLTRKHFIELNGRQIYADYILINRLIGDRMLCCILPNIEGILITAVDVCWIAPTPYYDSKYLMYTIASPMFQAKVKSVGAGTTRFRISKGNLTKLLFPLPPLAEQKRIVAKIEELLPHVEQYGKAHDELTALNEKFPDAMKKSVLQYAMEGKLVEQRKEEGTTKELLAAIKAEKAKLVKEGQLKKEKPLPEIKAEEIPFEIPESWEWVRLGEIAVTNIGLTYKPTNIVENGGTIVLRSSNIQNDKIDYSETVRVNMNIPENKMCSKGDILICVRNGSKRLVGKAALIEDDGMSFGAFMAILSPIITNNRYIMRIINSAYFRNTLLNETGTTTINQITQNMLKEVLFPLPPLAEQKRIVAKIEELLSCCGALGNESTA